MQNPWVSEWLRTLLIIAACGIAGLIFGAFHLGVTLGFMIVLLRLYHRIHLFYRWFNRNWLGNHPQDTGIIESLYYRGRYLQNRNETQKKHLEGIIKRFQKSSRAMPDAVITLNERNEVQWINKAAQALIGLKRKQDVGLIVSNLIRNPEFIRYLDNEDFSYPIEFPSPLNEKIQMHARIIPYSRDSRLLIIRDVTQIHNLEKMRRDFIASASHELRTPLTVITGYLESMQDMDRTHGNEEIIDTMLHQSQRMESIIKDMLLLAQLDSLKNHKEHTRKPVNIKQLIDSIYAGIQAAGTWSHHIKLDIDTSLGINGNETELHSAFSNLIINALRYTPPDSTITVTWRHHKNHAVYSVEDNGPGIAPEHLPRLTERFYRVDTGRSRDTGGTGLGLTIVQQIMKHHDGQLWVDSKVGSGSKFTCEFPNELIIRQPPQLRIIGS